MVAPAAVCLGCFPAPKRRGTPAGEALTNLMLDLFRLTSRLPVGDESAAGLGLTSARWQILGAITSAEHPQPVAWLARDLGANRQNVQRIVNDLHKRDSSHSRSTRITGEPNSSR